MTDSVYRKTPLPVKLNLNDRNTKEQLTSSNPDDTGRGALEGVGPASSTKTSQNNCKDVMRKDLRDWLDKHGINGPPPSPEAEQRAMWQWIRDFHKEYNDDWFARNMPRMLEQFRPIFNEEMKRMKAEVKASAAAANVAAAGDAAPAKAAPAQAVNLLDFDQPPQQNAAPSVAAAGGVAAGGSTTGDLLSLDGGGLLGDAAPVTTAAPAMAPAPVAVYTAPSSGGGLLDLGSLDVIGDSPALPGPMSAPVAVAPSGGYSAAPVQADTKGGGGSGGKDPLFDLLM